MSDILHAWALAPAAIGTCCLAADRRRVRVRVPEISASALMLLAMLDASRVAPLVPPVYWAIALIIAGMALAIVRRTRGNDVGRPDRTRSDGPGMTLHTAIGMIVMAALLIGMGHSDAVGSGHAHGMTSVTFAMILVAGSAVYAVGSLVAAARAHGWFDRIQFVAMGASTSVMGLTLLS